MDLCDPCDVGSFQPTTGQKSCARCARGSFQGSRGMDKCAPCGAGSSAPDTSLEGIELVDMRAAWQKPQEFVAALSVPFTSAGATFDMMSPTGREQLARALWAGDFSDSTVQMRSANPQLVAVLRAQITNTRAGGGLDGKDRRRRRRSPRGLQDVRRGPNVVSVGVLARTAATSATGTQEANTVSSTRR